MRALIPPGFVEISGAEAATAKFESWFGDAEELGLIRSGSDAVGDRLHVFYRLRVKKPGSLAKLVEQHLLCTLDTDRIEGLDLVCTGFRPDAEAGLGSPDETRSPDKTTVEIVRMGGVAASRMRLEPGWRWSECIKPIAGGERCQAHHVGFLQSGAMHVVHDDGTEQEIQAGQAYVIEPGHDAWVTSSDDFVGLEFDSRTAGTFAKS